MKTVPGFLSTFSVQLLGVHLSPSRPPAGRSPCQAAPRGFKIRASSFLVPNSCWLGRGPAPGSKPLTFCLVFHIPGTSGWGM